MDAEPARHDEERRYIPARLTVDGRDLGQVGVRYKGAFGTFRTCLPDGGRGPAVPYAPPPEARCPPVPKFSYKISFDELDPGNRPFGLRKINLHNLIRDPSLLHEQLASRLFREMGIPAPRSSFARVTVNGVRKGIYALTEDVGDGRFTADHWPGDPDGNLYKQVWPVGADERAWKAALATNRRPSDPDAAARRDRALTEASAFSEALRAAGSDGHQAAAVLARWSDPDWLARYLAVDTAIRNVDGVTKLHCRPGQPDRCSPNNFYWYQTRAGRFLLIPWDLDYTFRVRVRQNHLPPWDADVPGPNVPDCTTRFQMYGSLHQAPACDPVFRGIKVERARYRQAVHRLLALPSFQADRLRADVDRLAALIAADVAADPAVPRTGPRAWPAMVALLRHDVGVLRARMEEVAAGRPHRPYPPTPEWEPLPDPTAPPPVVKPVQRSESQQRKPVE